VGVGARGARGDGRGPPRVRHAAHLLHGVRRGQRVLHAPERGDVRRGRRRQRLRVVPWTVGEGWIFFHVILQSTHQYPI
jgi:hypothetical protein